MTTTSYSVLAHKASNDYVQLRSIQTVRHCTCFSLLRKPKGLPTGVVICLVYSSNRSLRGSYLSLHESPSYCMNLTRIRPGLALSSNRHGPVLARPSFLMPHSIRLSAPCLVQEFNCLFMYQSRLLKALFNIHRAVILSIDFIDRLTTPLPGIDPGPDPSLGTILGNSFLRHS